MLAKPVTSAYSLVPLAIWISTAGLFQAGAESLSAKSAVNLNRTAITGPRVVDPDFGRHSMPPWMKF
jgi:hypothetical protein